MKAEILTIGDEVMRGEIVDTNKSFLADRLLGLDIETHFQTSVRDDPSAMIDAFQRAATRSEITLVSGGLGPTRDDLTSEALAEALRVVIGQEVLRSQVLDQGREAFADMVVAEIVAAVAAGVAGFEEAEALRERNLCGSEAL